MSSSRASTNSVPSPKDRCKCPADDFAGLKRDSVRGGVITFVAQGISIAVQLASTVILSRLLAPADYGIMAMIIAITAFAGLFRDLGLSAASIQKGTLTHAQMSNLFWLNVGMGIFLSVAVAAASPGVAWFYGKPELVPLTLLLSTTFFVGSLATQHGALLVREMHFGRRSAAGIIGSIVGLILSIVLAIYGWGYWALAWGNIAGSIATTVCLFFFSSFRPGLWSKGAGIRSMMKFGANVTAFDLVNYFHRNLDNVLIGKYWGAGMLGFYSRAYSLLMLPLNSLRGPINAVGFPALSRLKDKPEEYRNYYRKVTAILALVSMPSSAFLFLSADSIVSLALGPHWNGIVPIFSVLAIVAFVQPVITLWGMVCLSLGMSRRYLNVGLFNALCSVLGFACGLPWGGVGVAIGYAAVTYLTAYPILAWTFHKTPLRIGDFTASVIRPFLASVIALVGCLMMRSSFEDWRHFTRIVVFGLMFSPLYLLVLRLMPGGKSELSFIIRVLGSVGTTFGLKYSNPMKVRS